MNSRLLPGWVNTAILSGLALVSLAAAALGVWNWLAIRGVKTAQAQEMQAELKQSPPAQPAVPSDLAPRLDNIQQRLDRLCNAPKLKAVCEGKSKDLVLQDPSKDPSQAASKKEKKAKREK